MIDNFDGCLCYVFLVCFWDGNKLYGKLFVLVFFIGNNGIIVFK